MPKFPGSVTVSELVNECFEGDWTQSYSDEKRMQILKDAQRMMRTRYLLHEKKLKEDCLERMGMISCDYSIRTMEQMIKELEGRKRVDGK